MKRSEAARKLLVFLREKGFNSSYYSSQIDFCGGGYDGEVYFSDSAGSELLSFIEEELGMHPPDKDIMNRWDSENENK